MPGGLEATPDHAPGKICRGLGARGQLVATPGREFLCSAPGAAPQTLRTQSRMKLVNIAHLMKTAETFPQPSHAEIAYVPERHRRVVSPTPFRLCIVLALLHEAILGSSAERLAVAGNCLWLT
jgi:hypothetical protein